MEDGRHTSSSMELEAGDPPPPPLSKKKAAGGWKSIRYILGNESFEKLASMSLVANITLYLHTQYNISGVLLVNVVTIWGGCSNMASLAGAVISDAYVGRFLTLLFGSLASFLGMGVVTLTAGVSHLRPPTCHDQSECTAPQKWQLVVLFVGLGLLSIGAGGIRPCGIAFGADQFDTTTEKGRKQLQSFFNWWYFSFTIGLIIALTGVVYIQTDVSWALGFAIPTICLSISILIFILGRHAYIYMEPQGNIFLDVAKVIVAAYSKRKASLDSQCALHDPPDHDSSTQKLARTDGFKYLDKAALITDSCQLNSQGAPVNSWRLCSVQNVEQLKCIMGILPVWLSGITCFVVMDQQSTFGVLQAIQMNRSIGKHFRIPPAWLTITSMSALSIWIFIYERIYVRRSKKITHSDARLTVQQRIETGIVMSILCMVVAGTVELRRRDSALKHGVFESPMCVGWLVPQFVLSGMMEAFAAVAIMEFLNLQMPESMRTVAGAIFFLSLSISSYVSSLLVNIIHGLSGRNGKSPWLGGHDLNKNRLEYYYYIIAALGVVNFMYFKLFARRFVRSAHVMTMMRLGEDELRRREVELRSLRTTTSCRVVDNGCKPEEQDGVARA